MTDTQTRPVVETPPTPQSPLTAPLGFGGGLRYLWTQLTSMRTALVLLFALAVAAIPGSLVPQSKISPIRVSEFIANHPTLGPLYDKVGLFHVYTSPWFSAIYLLLFVSLVGCIIPRVGVYARAVRSQPPRTPRLLSRLPVHESVEVGSGDQVVERAAAALRSRHYRVVTEADTVSAERGYLREAGNLVFHISLLVLLVGVGIGSLSGFRGTTVVIAGQGFANNLTQYDDISAGASFRADDLVPFSLVVKNFDVKFETGPVQRGAARLFKADLQVTEAPGDKPYDKALEVNHPLTINGTTVHLIGHGYAPRVTVKDAKGQVAYSGPVPFLPQDGNFTSAGVIKAPDARPNRMAFQGLFLPTAVQEGSAAPSSAFPDAWNPTLLVTGWYGPPKVETGLPENIYSLNTAGMTQMKDAKGVPLRIALQPGDIVKLPNGLGTLQLDGWSRWVKLQVGDSPGSGIALAAIAFAVTGLCLSLFVRPRRIWVRVGKSASGTTLVEVAGLDRADARVGLDEEVAELAAELAAGAPPAPTTDGSAAPQQENGKRT